MDQLKEVNQSLEQVKSNLVDIEKEQKIVEQLDNKLGELKKEASKHRQFKSAKENVRNLLNVQDWIKQANKHLDDGCLLLAHKYIMDIERCRNDILEELGDPKDNNDNIDDIKVFLFQFQMLMLRFI